MRLVTVAGATASCGDLITGNPKVLVEGKPISVVEQSTAGGLILGPGSPKVLIQGDPVSVVGDVIAPHGDNAHSAAVTQTIATKVFVP
jgi:uncharacterized Zn-binding protein involved in type VI secretion